MATYKQVSYGSQGSDVTELQKLLNNNGYSLDVDGVYGAKTQAAVKDYQQKNNLAVDGIVGNNTWGALTKASTPAATTTPATSTQATKPDTQEKAKTFSYGEYKPNDAVSQAQQMLNQQLSQKPGEYQSSWQDQINETLQQILNREKFSYDLNADALYQQYKDQYTTQGKMAMMDTMGQAQAMTGGYGNSYAQSVGQQAYQGYLQELNNKIPELYQLALNKYQMEGDALTDQYALLAQQENQDYGRYRDQMGDWQTERDFLTDRYDTERDYDYGKWADGRDFAYGQFADDRAYDYQVGRDKAADEQWQKEFDEAKRQFDAQMALKTGTAVGGSSGGSGGGSGNGSGGGVNNSGYSSDLVKMAQAYVGATPDGQWGSKSADAAGDQGYSSLTQVLNAMGLSSNGALAGNQGNNYTPKPQEEERDYDWVVSQMNSAISSAGKDASSQRVLKGDIQDLLVASRQAGYITQAEYNKLYKTYSPRGLTY